MSKHFFVVLFLVGALMITGAGCGSSSSNNSSSKSNNGATPASQAPSGYVSSDYDDTEEVDAKEETPELSENSTTEDYEEVISEMEDLSADLEGMNQNINSLNSVNTEL